MPSPDSRLRFIDRVRSPDQSEAARFGSLGQPPGRADIAERSPFQRIVYPPRVEKLLSSTDFTVQDFAMVLPAGAGSTITSAALAFTLPASMVGWLQEFKVYVLSQTAATSAQWSVRINGGPVPGFDNKQNAPGVANLVLLEWNDMRIRIPNGATVDVIITNLNANGPWTVGGYLAGWYHPWVDEDRIFGNDGY